MFVIQVSLLLFSFCYLISKSRGLEELIVSEEDIILVTESAIRNITNNLFIGLNLRGIKLNPKLKQSSIVHNFFTSVTLKDHKTLNEIVRLSRINKNKDYNETEGYVTLINEILNDDSNSADDIDTIASNEDIIHYVDEFLTNIDGFKESSGINDKYESLEIKDELLHILQSNVVDKLNVPKQNETLDDKIEDEVLSDNEFWVPESETRRIYRGDKTKIKYFPFMASIQIFNSFQCAGSIIKSDLIITAASCLQLAWNNRFFRENPAFLSVRVGSNFYNGGGENIAVLEVYFHPDYNPRNLRHNIAVCRLHRHLKFRRHKRRLKKIEIDTYDSPLPMTTDGITIVGWGAKGASNIIHDPWSNQLAFAVLDVYHLQECQEIYSREYVTRTNFCAGFVSKGGGACNRDVGGPGVVSGKLTGIVSFGSPVCGTPDAPTVFTKVGYYADWIEEIMEQNVPHAKKQTTLIPEKLPPTFPNIGKWKQTTFKLSPIIGNPTPKPIPIQQIDGNRPDNLRILEDEELFKEFLATMFESKEAEEYKDLFIDDSAEKPINLEPHGGLKIKSKGQKRRPVEHKVEKEIIAIYDSDNVNEEESITESLGSGTKMDTFKRVTKEPGEKYTAIDDNLPTDNNIIERNIAKLIDNIDVNETEENSDSDDNESDENEDANYEQATVGPAHRHSNKVADKILKNKDDANVLTLLYISDNERANATSLDTIGNIIEDFDENFDNDGLAISMDGFKDMTFRNNKSSVLDFMSKGELYDLLSEAIDEVAKNKNV